MTLYATAGERIYGERIRNGNAEDYHHCTLRHDLRLGELPDFPACLGDWQQNEPPRIKQAITTAVGTATTAEDGTVTGLTTNTAWIELDQHGGGEAPVFGVPWSGESWWRVYDHGGTRASLHYDLRFRGTDGMCTWGMDRLKGMVT